MQARLTYREIKLVKNLFICCYNWKTFVFYNMLSLYFNICVISLCVGLLAKLVGNFKLLYSYTIVLYYCNLSVASEYL